ncbi:MAG: polymer-forming cytoskeletal protein [Patescibacteria group bacterium]
MFKSNSTGHSHETDTVIGPSVKLEGDFVTEGNIIIDGIVSGEIKTARNLKVGAGSKIFANVSAENALVAGEIQGNVRITNRLELTSSAKVFGDIKTGILAMAAGAMLSGKCQVGDEKSRSPKIDFSRQEKIELSPLEEIDRKNKIKK